MSELEPKSNGGRLPLHARILIGLLIGITLGLAANALGLAAKNENLAPGLAELLGKVHSWTEWLAGNVAEPLGKVFLRLVLMVVVPLVVSALALGVVGMGDVRKIGRVGARTLALTAVLSSAAVVVGITLVNVFEPGKSLSDEKRHDLLLEYSQDASRTVTQAAAAKTWQQMLLDMIPENPLQEMVGAVDGSSKGNGMLAVMFFSLAVGIALSTMTPDKSRPIVALLEGLFELSMKVIGFAMRIAPVAVACLVYALASRLGLEILKTLGVFVLVVTFGLAFHLFVTYSAMVYFIGRMSPLAFFRGAREAMLTAFGTSSSNATLPTALRVAEKELGVGKQVSEFVLTIGATANQNGTALYEGVVVLFLAQVFGVDLTLGQQVTVVLMSILAGVGTAGVPGGSLPMIVIVMQSVGVPANGIGIILGIDRLLDMMRTVVNVTGDLALAKCVDAWEQRAAN